MSDSQMSSSDDPESAPEPPPAPALQPDPAVVTIVVKGSQPPPDTADVIHLTETRGSES